MAEVEANLIQALFLSLLSGIGVFLHGVREERIKASSLNLLTELVLAVLAGLIAYYIARHKAWDDSLLYLAVLVVSNNGREVSTALKNRLIDTIQYLFGPKGGRG
ncbi:TPA: holin [Citrobacter freundii]|nr:holin [Citrobacter freundii]